MEKRNTPSSSICRKFRQALAGSPAFRSIHRIKQYLYHREPRPFITHSNSPSSPPTHLPINTGIPQHIKFHPERGGAIPILFDYSTPTTMGNGNSTTSMVHVGISERAGKVAAKVEPEPQHEKRPTKVEAVGFPTNEGSRAAVFKGETSRPLKGQHHHYLGVQHSEQQGKKSLDINDTFTEYIQRAKCRIRTVSNVGKGQNNSAPDAGNGTTNEMEKENQNDHFSDFIQHAKKRFRTTSNIGNTSSLKRGEDLA